MTDDELVEILHGNLGKSTSYAASSYLDEINRRAVNRQSAELIALTASLTKLTVQIRTLTWLVLLVALAALGIAAVPLVRG